MAENAYAMTSKELLIRYLHQFLFSQTKKTVVKAIENNQLTTLPGLTADAVRKHLPDYAPATDKNHIKRQRKGVRSTTKIPPTKTKKGRVKYALDKIELERDINLPQENEKNNQIFCYNGRINTKDRTIYVDFTGKLPIRSMDGMVAIFIVYDWTTNAILATTIKNMAEETIVSCFKQKYNIPYKKRFQTHPQHHRQCGVKSSAIVPRGRECQHTTCGAAQP